MNITFHFIVHDIFNCLNFESQIVHFKTRKLGLTALYNLPSLFVQKEKIIRKHNP